MFNFTGKTVLITGASYGLGASFAEGFAAAGANLVLTARSKDLLEATGESCRKLGAKVLCVTGDVSKEDDVKRVVAAGIKEFGGIDTLVNNAGISAHALLEDVPADKLAWYEQLMRVNLWGSVYCTHAALPHLKNSHGRIVAVSSLAGLVGVPGRTAYSASKFGLVGMMQSIREEIK